MVLKMRWLILIGLIACGGQIKINAQEATETPTEEKAEAVAQEAEQETKTEEKIEEEKPTNEVAAESEKKAEETPVQEKEVTEETKPEEAKVEEEKPTEEAPAQEITPEPEKEAEKTEGAPAEEKETEEPAPEEEEEIEGIDTVDVEIPAGNWLLKRYWWEKAKNKFNKIRLAVNKVADTPMQFFSKQNELEKTVLDPFYREVGFEQGELQEIISSLIAKLNEEQEERGELEFEERDVLKVLQSEQKRLEQLEKDVNAINDLDGKLDEALTLLLQQVNKARNYENQAWQQFDAIAHELSDKKAQEFYYSMDALLKSIQEIDVYIYQKFNEYFTNIVNSAKTQIDRIKDNISSLKKQGIDLKEQVSQLVEEEEEVAEEKPAERKTSVSRKPTEGIMTRFLNVLKGLWNNFLSLFKRK